MFYLYEANKMQVKIVNNKLTLFYLAKNLVRNRNALLFSPLLSLKSMLLRLKIVAFKKNEQIIYQLHNDEEL